MTKNTTPLMKKFAEYFRIAFLTAGSKGLEHTKEMGGEIFLGTRGDPEAVLKEFITDKDAFLESNNTKMQVNCELTDDPVIRFIMESGLNGVSIRLELKNTETIKYTDLAVMGQSLMRNASAALSIMILENK